MIDRYGDMRCDGPGTRRRVVGCDATVPKRPEWSAGALDAAARHRGWAVNPGGRMLGVGGGAKIPEHLCPACLRVQRSSVPAVPANSGEQDGLFDIVVP